MKHIILSLTPDFLKDIAEWQLNQPVNLKCILLYVFSQAYSYYVVYFGIPSLQVLLADEIGWLSVLLSIISGAGSIILAVVTYVSVQLFGPYIIKKVKLWSWKRKRAKIKAEKLKLKVQELL